MTTAYQSKASVEDFVKHHTFNILAIIFVLDNAANVHIGNNINMFQTLNPCTQRCIATIGGTAFQPEGIGTVLIRVKYNKEVLSNMLLEDVLYFPSSPVNLISITCLADQLKDNERTFIRTARYHSDFTWNFGAHTTTIHHAQIRIPEMEVSTEKSTLHVLTTTINLLHPRSRNHVFNVNVITDNNKDTFTPSSSTIKPTADNSEIVITEFETNDKLTYCRDGRVEQVTLQSSTYSNDSFIYDIKLPKGTVIKTTWEFLCPIHEPDNITLPYTLSDYKDIIS